MDRVRIARDLVRLAKKLTSQEDDFENYRTINDVYDSGNTEIWYMKPSFYRDGGMGVDWLEKKGLMPDPWDLDKTHVFLGRIGEKNLKNIFKMMQGEFWSPNGEAKDVISRKGLHHTSMTTGDIVIAGGKVYIVDRYGFKELQG